MTRAMIVTVDDRERCAELVSALARMPGLVVVRRRLDVGDFLWGDRLVVERKALSDLVSSIESQRFFRQMHRLRNAGPASCLLLEGTVDQAARLGMRRQAIQGALICASLVHGVPILRSCDAVESAWVMARAAAQLAMAGRGKRPSLSGGLRQDTKRKLQRYVLEGVPGIGPERAGLLLEHFGKVNVTGGGVWCCR